MRIKRVEIIGFKSFSERAVVNFDRAITAVVGPNGCGKSNILDAMSWVLGEQSVKSLRGAQSEDLIFNGTEKKRPLGMAEVTRSSREQFEVCGMGGGRGRQVPAGVGQLGDDREFQPGVFLK